MTEAENTAKNRMERLEKLAPALLPWYEEHGRKLPWRKDSSPYHVWISEIMLQQTRIETVIPYYHRFLQELPDIRSLAEADPEHLWKLWEGLGYYSRARNLQEAAKQIMEKHSGHFPEKYEEIRDLRGIGDYTAGAIASICFHQPEPAVDGNVLRVLSRITGDLRPVTEEKTKKTVRNELLTVYPKEAPGEFTQALMELGETICLPGGVPDCSGCPCRDFCFSSQGEWKNLPVKTEKKPRKKENLTVFLLQSHEHTAIRKRPAKGLLSGLWELPNTVGDSSPEEAFGQAELWGCRPSSVTEEKREKHVFTHVEWDMHCYRIECGCESSCFTWVDDIQLSDSVSLPTAFRKCL